MANINHLPVGQAAKVLEVNSDAAFSQRLMTLGLLPGVEVKIVQVAPLGDPIVVEFGHRRVSLRRAEAAGISVEQI